jgi:hypothetical protein
MLQVIAEILSQFPFWTWILKIALLGSQVQLWKASKYQNRCTCPMTVEICNVPIYFLTWLTNNALQIFDCSDDEVDPSSATARRAGPTRWVQRKQLKLLNCGYRLLQLNWSSNFREFPTPEEHSVRRYSQTVLYLFRGNPNITVHVTPFYLANPMLLQAVCIQQFCCLALQWIFFLK